jgi:hypothetical protein
LGRPRLVSWEMAPRPTTAAGVRVCEQCQRLRDVYLRAIVEAARLECLKSSLDEGPLEQVHSLDAQVEMAEHARINARDALQTHRIEKRHS